MNRSRISSILGLQLITCSLASGVNITATLQKGVGCVTAYRLRASAAQVHLALCTPAGAGAGVLSCDVDRPQKQKLRIHSRASVLETLLTPHTQHKRDWSMLQTATYRRQKRSTQTDTKTSTPCGMASCEHRTGCGVSYTPAAAPASAEAEQSINQSKSSKEPHEHTRSHIPARPHGQQNPRREATQAWGGKSASRKR